MKWLGKTLTAVAAAALTIAPTASVGQERHRDRDRHNDRDAIIAGVAILGGIAAIAAASDRDGRRYGGSGRYRYRQHYRNAVNACGAEAERFARGGVQITDVRRRSENKYRVKGMIRAGYGMRYDRWGSQRSRWAADRSRPRYFACTARGNGRVTDFDLNGRDIW